MREDLAAPGRGWKRRRAIASEKGLRRFGGQHVQKVMHRRFITLFRIEPVLQRLVARKACEVSGEEEWQCRLAGWQLAERGDCGPTGLAQHGLGQILAFLHRNDRKPQRRLAPVHVDVSPTHGAIQRGR